MVCQPGTPRKGPPIHDLPYLTYLIAHTHMRRGGSRDRANANPDLGCVRCGRGAFHLQSDAPGKRRTLLCLSCTRRSARGALREWPFEVPIGRGSRVCHPSLLLCFRGFAPFVAIPVLQCPHLQRAFRVSLQFSLWPESTPPSRRGKSQPRKGRRAPVGLVGPTWSRPHDHPLVLLFRRWQAQFSPGCPPTNDRSPDQ